MATELLSHRKYIEQYGTSDPSPWTSHTLDSRTYPTINRLRMESIRHCYGRRCIQNGDLNFNICASARKDRPKLANR
jgi:hypothetical protein